METGLPPGEVIICHWDNGENTYEQQQLPASALNGHEQHERDIWPPYEGITEGMNWPAGQGIFEDGCELPETGGISPLLLLLAITFAGVGFVLLWASARPMKRSKLNEEGTGQ